MHTGCPPDRQRQPAPDRSAPSRHRLRSSRSPPRRRRARRASPHVARSITLGPRRSTSDRTSRSTPTTRAHEHGAWLPLLRLPRCRLRTADQAPLPGLPPLEVGEGRARPTGDRRRRRRARRASGATARSVASSPSRRRSRPPSDSSTPSLRLLAEQVLGGPSTPFATTTPATGTPRRCPRGCRTGRPSATARDRRRSTGGHRSCPVLRVRRPTPCTSSTAHGLRARNESAPAGSVSGPDLDARGACRRDARLPRRTVTSSEASSSQQPVGDREAGHAAADDGDPAGPAPRSPGRRPRRRADRAPPGPARPGTRGRRWACACGRTRCRLPARSRQLRCRGRRAPRGGRRRSPALHTSTAGNPSAARSRITSSTGGPHHGSAVRPALCHAIIEC